jgi:GPI inositol-deacylase
MHIHFLEKLFRIYSTTCPQLGNINLLQWSNIQKMCQADLSLQNSIIPMLLNYNLISASQVYISKLFLISGLMTHGLHQSFPINRAVTTELNIPALESSLLTYTLQVTTNNCHGQLFRPLVRQSIAEPYESKFFVNVHDADINLHGLAPYLVSQVRRNGAVPSQGVTLQFWTDPTCDSPLDIQIKFDLMGSFGKTVIRYRIALAAFPLAIVALCLKRQFSEYNTSGIFLF